MPQAALVPDVVGKARIVGPDLGFALVLEPLEEHPIEREGPMPRLLDVPHGLEIFDNPALPIED